MNPSLDLIRSNEAALTRLYEALEGYEDGAPDASSFSKTANHVLVDVRVQLAKLRSYIARAEKPRDFETDPLTDYEKVVLTLAQYDLQYSRLQSAAQAVIDSQYPLTSAQVAVLATKLNALDDIASEEKPQWPTPTQSS